MDVREDNDFFVKELDVALPFFRRAVLPFFRRAALPFFRRAANAPFLKIASLHTDWSVLHYVFKK